MHFATRSLPADLAIDWDVPSAHLLSRLCRDVTTSERPSWTSSPSSTPVLHCQTLFFPRHRLEGYYFFIFFSVPFSTKYIPSHTGFLGNQLSKTEIDWVENRIVQKFYFAMFTNEITQLPGAVVNFCNQNVWTFPLQTLNSSLDHALRTATILKQTTDQMIRTIAEDLAKVQRRRKELKYQFVSRQPRIKKKMQRKLGLPSKGILLIIQLMKMTFQRKHQNCKKMGGHNLKKKDL